ncbi:MAG TPA: MBL fold metallo-hydrolase [Streptosporangiaceae bacterium]|nr:MBL fold metallo-hydrolase [Streptosporangiaceae bacterium]
MTGPATPGPPGGPAGIDGSGTARARCVLAPNPSPMTLDGTNTWLIAEPGGTEAVVVDPGPDDEGHLRRVRSVAQQNGLRIAGIILTHGHSDHAAGARSLAAATGAGVRAVDRAHRLGSEGLPPGSVVATGGTEIEVIATPGHTIDSVCLYLRADEAVLTGDTVLGRGTTVIAPDGSLGDYLRSLDQLRALADSTELTALLPGHGPLLADPRAVLDFYAAHRAERLDQIRAALAAGDRTAPQIVARVYADVDRHLWPAAELSVLAQLGYLADRGELPPGVSAGG